MAQRKLSEARLPGMAHLVSYAVINITTGVLESSLRSAARHSLQLLANFFLALYQHWAHICFGYLKCLEIFNSLALGNFYTRVPRNYIEKSCWSSLVFTFSRLYIFASKKCSFNFSEMVYRMGE